MKVELSERCAGCDNRPACEVAAVKGKHLEEAAKKLGFTVTEGALTCLGPRWEEILEDNACQARLSPPDLASAEERAKIAELSGLDVQVSALLPDAQDLIRDSRLRA